VLLWTSVALLVIMILTANEFDGLDTSPERITLIRQHTSWGLLFLLLMSLRLFWRFTNENPVLSYNIHNWQKFSARFLHGLIYVVVITQSLSGLLKLISDGSGIPFFTLFEIPPLMLQQEVLHEFLKSVHYVLAVVIYPLFAIHISAAIYHQLFAVVDDPEIK
jgi:cytochrome b561